MKQVCSKFEKKFIRRQINLVNNGSFVIKKLTETKIKILLSDIIIVALIVSIFVYYVNYKQKYLKF